VVSLPDLEHAWRIIIARHQTLRTWFDGSSDEPVQCIEPIVEFWIPVVDLTGLSEEAAQPDEQHRFPGKPMEVHDVHVRSKSHERDREAHQSTRCSLTAHHLVCDGWSIGCLAQEMGEICAAQHDGRAPSLPDLTANYGDYALGKDIGC
jgi:hypothetical protein